MDLDRDGDQKLKETALSEDLPWHCGPRLGRLCLLCQFNLQREGALGVLKEDAYLPE